MKTRTQTQGTKKGKGVAERAQDTRGGGGGNGTNGSGSAQIGGRLALAKTGYWTELLRKDEIEADELEQNKSKPSEAEGTEYEEESGPESGDSGCIQEEALSRTMTRPTLEAQRTWGRRDEENPHLAGTGQPTSANTKRVEDKETPKCHRIGPPKPMLADHAAMEALGRVANLTATARKSERLREATACRSLVAAKCGTKRKLRPLQTGTTLRRLVGATLVAHDEDNLRQTVEQAQLATAVQAGIELVGHARQDLAWLQLDCTNAFGELSFEAQWLTQQTRAITRDEKGDWNSS